LDEYSDGFEGWVFARAEENRFCNVEEGAAEEPSGRKGIEFGDYGENNLDYKLGFGSGERGGGWALCG
jgi:hypothetical protein